VDSSSIFKHEAMESSMCVACHNFFIFLFNMTSRNCKTALHMGSELCVRSCRRYVVDHLQEFPEELKD
jgi:hypothetical protein